MSENLDAFLASYAGYVNRRLDANIQWTIEVEPGSLLERFSRNALPLTREYFSDFGADWVYRKAGQQREGCELNFDPETLRATFLPAG